MALRKTDPIFSTSPLQTGDTNALIMVEIFAPNSQVWFMTDHGLRQQRILRVTTESRAILSDLTHTETAITYLLDDGTSRPAHEVFATKEQLISSL